MSGKLKIQKLLKNEMDLLKRFINIKIINILNFLEKSK